MSELGSSPDDRKRTRFDGAVPPRSEGMEGVGGDTLDSPGSAFGGSADGEIRDVSLEALLGRIDAALAALATLDEPIQD